MYRVCICLFSVSNSPCYGRRVKLAFFLVFCMPIWGDPCWDTLVRYFLVAVFEHMLILRSELISPMIPHNTADTLFLHNLLLFRSRVERFLVGDIFVCTRVVCDPYVTTPLWPFVSDTCWITLCDRCWCNCRTPYGQHLPLFDLIQP